MFARRLTAVRLAKTIRMLQPIMYCLWCHHIAVVNCLNKKQSNEMSDLDSRDWPRGPVLNFYLWTQNLIFV